MIIFGVGGWGGRRGGGEGVGNFCPTQAHAACDTLLMLLSELFPVTFEAHLEAVVTLQDSWQVARCLARCKMLETFHNIVDE